MEILLAMIAILPQAVVVGVGGGLVIQNRESLKRYFHERVSSVSAFGVRVDLRPADIDAAVQASMSAKGIAAVGPTSIGTGEQVVERAKRLAPRLAGRTILWVDDHPEGNRTERRLLRELGIFTESVTTNMQALEILSDPAETVDLVITDIGRDDGSPDGLVFLDSVRVLAEQPPVICYVGQMREGLGTPPGAFGITNRPDVLLNLIMDALDR